MSKTAGDILVQTLIDFGVDTVFGLPGDGINGIMESLRKRKDEIRFIQVRHEESASFMACGYAKFTGKLGCCLATSGPGGIHLLNGLYDAKLDGQPVLAITGLHHHDLLNTYSQQDVDLDRVFEDVTVYNARAMGPDHVQNIAALACRKAVGYKSVAHISIPVDFQSMEVNYDKASDRNIPNHVATQMKAAYHQVPVEDSLKDAATVINSAQRPLILAGRGALGAGDELIELAEKIGAPIVKALLGKAAVPDDSVYTTGGIGLLGTRPSEEAMKECDALIMVGTSFPYLEYYPDPGQAKAVQIDVDPTRLGLRYPVDVGLVGDSKIVLKHLLPQLEYKRKRKFLEKAQEGMRRWWDLMKERGTQESVPMKPQVVAWELGQRLADNAIITCDSGTSTTWWARQIPAKKGQLHSVSGNLASMAVGLPYAIAAQLAYPDRPVYAFVGDGGFSMLMAEYITAVRYKLPIKVIIVKNNSLGQIKWEQMVFLGNPEYECDLTEINFKKFAEACGTKGITIENPESCGALLDIAIETEGPVIVEAVVDPHEPPMPAKVSFDQAKAFSESVVKGTPDAAKLVARIGKQQVREMI